MTRFDDDRHARLDGDLDYVARQLARGDRLAEHAPAAEVPKSAEGIGSAILVANARLLGAAAAISEDYAATHHLHPRDQADLTDRLHDALIGTAFRTLMDR